MAVVQQLLDQYRASLFSSGFPEFEVAKAPTPEVAARKITTAGLNPLPEVVEWFTWGEFPVEGKESFFWETGWIPDLDSSMRIRELFANDRDDPQDVWSYPGTSDWLVIAHLDTSEIVAVDAGFGPQAGSVWFVYGKSGTPSLRMFSSLAEALGAASFCVESGLWTIDGHRLESPNTGMPSFSDLLEPPHAADGKEPRYYVHPIEVTTNMAVAVGEFDGRLECKALGSYTISELAKNGHRLGPPMALSDLSKMPTAPRTRSINFSKHFDPAEWDLRTIDQDGEQWGVLFSLHEPGQSWFQRRWIDPGQLAELSAMGLVAPFTCGQHCENWPIPNALTTKEIAELAADPRWLRWQNAFSG